MKKLRVNLRELPKKIKSLGSLHSTISEVEDKNYEGAPFESDLEIIPINEDARIQQLLQKPKVVIIRVENKHQLKPIGHELTIGNIVIVNLEKYLESASPAELTQLKNTLMVISDTHDAKLLGLDKTGSRVMFVPLKVFDVEKR